MKILYISTAIPSLTLTFVYREIFGLEKKGFFIRTVSMHCPPDAKISKEARVLKAKTYYLDQVTLWEKLTVFLSTPFKIPRRFFQCFLLFAKAKPMKFPMDYVRLFYHWIEACYLIEKFKSEEINHVHCHFISGPTSIGMFFAKLRNIPYSFTMHASNIWLFPIALMTKLKNSRFSVSISDYNRQYICETYGEQYTKKIHIIRCGIDPQGDYSKAIKNSTKTPYLKILAVGQLAKRKGFHVLIEACYTLRQQGLQFECTIIGGGPEEKNLRHQVLALAVDDIVTLAGALPQEKVVRYYRDADIFVLPSVIVENGQRDGIPVVLMEAMAWRLPVISTTVSGIPELIEAGKTGLLVPPEDAQALTQSIVKLAQSVELRTQLGEAGCNKVMNDFNINHSVNQLMALFHQSQALESVLKPRDVH